MHPMKRSRVYLFPFPGNERVAEAAHNAKPLKLSDGMNGLPQGEDALEDPFSLLIDPVRVGREHQPRTALMLRRRVEMPEATTGDLGATGNHCSVPSVSPETPHLKSLVPFFPSCENR
jgi:hypothetical protein